MLHSPCFALKMRLLDLPNEILYLVADKLSRFNDLSHFTLTSRFVHALLTDYLYRRAARDIPPDEFPSPALVYSIRHGLKSSVIRLLEWTSRVPAKRCWTSPLTQAVIDNQDPGIARLLLEHWGVSGIDHWSKGLLLEDLIYEGAIEMIRLLLEFGHDANQLGLLGSCPLTTAVSARRPEIVTLLLDYGADINGGESFLAPLHVAIEEQGMVELLVQRGADVNFAGPAGDTALHLIASQEFRFSWTPDLVGLLADNGANLQTRNKEGKTALDIAVEQENDLCQASLLDAMLKSQTSRDS